MLVSRPHQQLAGSMQAVQTSGNRSRLSRCPWTNPGSRVGVVLSVRPPVRLWLSPQHLPKTQAMRREGVSNTNDTVPLICIAIFLSNPHWLAIGPSVSFVEYSWP